MTSGCPDAVLIEDLMVYAKIGCTEEESSYPQRLLVCAEVRLSLSDAAESKQLNDSVCFSQLAALYSAVAGSTRWTLLEELAETLISQTFITHQEALEVTLKIKKFAVPNTAWVGIEMRRSRSEL
jgi:dihydroneopterin aldolase